MNFLKKFGQVVANIAGVVAGIGPIFSKALPGKSGEIATTVTGDFEQAAGIVGLVESSFAAAGMQQSGAQKLMAATPAVAQAILQSTLMVGKKIADPVAFQKACGEITGGIADLLNSLHQDSVQVAALPK